jgi:cytochrome c553
MHTITRAARARPEIRVFLGALVISGLSFILVSCGKPDGGDVTASDSTFSSINSRIIQASCVHCHPGIGPYNFTSYSSLMASGTIIPGNPLSSLFYIEVANGDMPEGGPPLSSSDVQSIYNWILAGATDDQSGPSPSPSPSALPPPTLASISPDSGPTLGMTSVALTGTGFQSGANVTVGGVACGDLSVLSSTQISCITGAHAAGAVSVVIENPDGQSATLSGAYTYASTSPPSPTISSISPTSGSGSGGTTLTISGTGFSSGATVSVGGSTCSSPAVTGSTTITCTTAVHLGGAATVTVTLTSGQSATLDNAYTYSSTYTGVNTLIIQTSCVRCHSGSGPGPGNFSNYTSLMASGFISAGNATGSTLYQETNSGAMPEGGPPLTAIQNQAIADWINSGAANN